MGLKLNIAHVINSIPCTNEINSIQNFINGKKKKKRSHFTLRSRQLNLNLKSKSLL